MPNDTQFTEINIAGEVNENLQDYTGGTNYPFGGADLTIAGVPFQLAGYGSEPDTTGAVQASGSPFSFSFPVPPGTTATVLYCLANSTYGAAGTNTGSIVVTGSGGETATLNFVEGVNIRDHIDSAWVNSLSDPTVVPTYFLDGMAANSGDLSRLDRQQLVLPTNFWEDTISSIVFQGNTPPKFDGAAFVAALTLAGPLVGPPVPAAITAQPANIGTNQGAPVSFTVTAKGSPPLSYQWLFDGGAIPNATNATLSLPNVNTNESGSYAVVVTNQFGATASSNALLMVNIPPSLIQQPLSAITSAGAGVTFSAGATGLPAVNYQWLFNGTPIPGATRQSLTLPPGATNAGYYSVVASNIAGTVTSSIAALTLFDVKNYAGLTIASPVATNVDVQAISAVDKTNWTTLTNVAIGSQPYFFIDYSSATNPVEFYRLVSPP